MPRTGRSGASSSVSSGCGRFEGGRESFRELLRGLERRASKARDEERALAAHVKELESEASAGQQALLAAIEKDETAAEEAGRAETEAAARKAKAARAAQAAEEKAAFEARVNEKRGKQRQVVEGSTPPISNQGTPRQSKATPRKTTSRKTTPRQTPRSKKQEGTASSRFRSDLQAAAELLDHFLLCVLCRLAAVLPYA
jgi:hypothetical protein